MKKSLLLLLFFSQFAFAQDRFVQANDYYKKGNYEQAAEAYELILQTKKESAELYFNLGNAYYKLNKVAPAIYFYEKALRLSPKDKEIESNLKFAEQMRIDDIKELPEAGFENWIRNLTGTFHYDTWAWIAVGFGAVLLIVFTGYYFTSSPSFKRMYFGGMFIALLLLAVSLFAASFEKSHFENDRPAIVFAEVIGVKGEPSATAADAFSLHAGTKVNVIETLENWRKIKLTDGNEGWIEQSAIKELK